MSQKAPKMPVLAYDLGGTKVAVGIVSPSGEVLYKERAPVELDGGKASLVKQLTYLGKKFLKVEPKIKLIGIASAGPLDPATGILLDPTNFSRNGKRFGKVELAKLLSKNLKRPVQIDNDAAAAILAEKWIGAAKGSKNAVILTLGTGLGTGIICNGELVRAGRGLHPEAGHIIIKYDDESALCGCGNYGCSEAYLSGNGFTRRAQIFLQDQSLNAKDVAELARRKHPKALELFKEYSQLLAVAIHNYVTLYAPEIVVLTGSFAQASDLYLKATEKELDRLLTRRQASINLTPKIILSKLQNDAGLIGGAIIALR